MLTLGWSDGSAFLPVNSILLSTENEKNRINEATKVDKRSIGYKRRKLSMEKGASAMLTENTELLKVFINYYFKCITNRKKSDKLYTGFIFHKERIKVTRMKQRKKLLAWLLSLAMLITGVVPGSEKKAEAKASAMKTSVTTPAPAPTEKPDEENQAFLMFTDKDYMWQNWNTKVCGGVGRDAVISGNGTYTVSIDKADFTDSDAAANPANGAHVFQVDIMGICNTQKFDASKIAISDVVVKCDGKEIKTDLSKMYEGDIEGKGNYRLEIRNEFGYGNGDFATKDEFDEMNPDFTFENSLSVTFTVTGIKAGKTPEGAFKTADDTSVVSVGGKRAEAVNGSQNPSGSPTKLPTPTRKPTATPTRKPIPTPTMRTGVITPTPAPTEKPDEENQAFLMFTDKDYMWQNWNTKVCGGVGRDAVISGNGTYTVSIDKADFTDSDAAANPANGAHVFQVDIMGICNTQKFDASKIAISDVVVKCDGKEIKTDLSKMYEGDIEGKGNYRLEIRNEFGYGNGDFATKDEFDEMNPDFTFENSLSVTFTVTGIKAGKTPEGAFKTADDTSVVSVGGKRTGLMNAATARPSKKPSYTRRPAGTKKPSYTRRPAGTMKPGTTRKPAGTTKPGSTNKPSGSFKPGNTSDPLSSAQPGNTLEPGSSQMPDTSSTPVGSAGPDSSKGPDGTTAPNSTFKPGQSAAPGETKAPVKTNGSALNGNNGSDADSMDTGENANPVKKLTAPKKLVLKKGKTKKVTVKIVAQDNTRKTTDKAVILLSNRKRIKVSGKKLGKGKLTFKVKAKKKGSAVITVILGDKVRKIKVKCK